MGNSLHYYTLTFCCSIFSTNTEHPTIYERRFEPNNIVIFCVCGWTIALGLTCGQLCVDRTVAATSCLFSVCNYILSRIVSFYCYCIELNVLSKQNAKCEMNWPSASTQLFTAASILSPCKMNPCSICAGFSTLCFDCKCYNKLTFHRVNNNKNENISVFSLYYYLATDYGFSMWCALVHMENEWMSFGETVPYLCVCRWINLFIW